MSNPENNPLPLLSAAFIKWLVLGSVLAFLLVYILTSPFFMKPVYRAESIIYVPLTLFSEQYDQQGIGFGSNPEIDGHIQILRSTRLVDSLDSRFNLTEKWNIELNSPGGRSSLYRKAGSVIRIEKNRYNALSVSVKDRDPEGAASMANAVVSLGDIIKKDILRDNRLAAYNFSRDLYGRKMKELGLTEENREATPAEKSENQLETQDHSTHGLLYKAELQELVRLKNDYEKMKYSLEVSLPGTYIISPAYPPDKPAWPGRLLLSFAAVPVYIVFLIFVAVIRQDAG